jgi:dihydropyrimidinase
MLLTGTGLGYNSGAMSYDLVIKGGMVVTAEATWPADVAIQGERIAAVGLDLPGEREIDATGKLVIPGGVDIHVHLEMPIGRFRSADSFFSGSRAAALGGTTTIIDFVEAAPDQPLVEALAARRALADPQVVIDYALHMTLGPAEIPRLDQLPDVRAAGCSSFKLYMAYGFCLSDGQMMQALEAVQAVEGMPVVHAENWDVICTLVARHLAHGRTQPHWHPRSRPDIMEGEAVGRVIDIARLAGAPLHIFHISCAAAAQQLAAARQRGLPVTGETCPQYLFLTQAAYEAPGVAGALPVCAPPLRPLADQAALWAALGRGDLQIVATDHCPFTQAEKATGLADFSQIPGGVPSIEMRLAAVYDGVRRGLLTENQWVAVCCTNPARRLGLAGKGEIAPGFDADLVIFDPQREKVLSTDTLHEQVDWTPYAGLRLQGWPVVTIRRGEPIVVNGEFVGQAGSGRYLRR